MTDQADAAALEKPSRADLEAALDQTTQDLLATRADLERAYRQLDDHAEERSRDLRNANETLSSEIARRRGIEQELRQALERAEAATTAKNQFLANMSHEIRTPMNGVLGVTQLLLRTELTEQQRAYADTAMLSGRALLAVIDDILDLSRIEAGKIEIRPRPFSPAVVVDEVEAMHRAIAEEREIELRTSVPQSDVKLIGDPDRIRQVLTNLVSNAVKFTDDGHVAIELALGEVDEPEVDLTFTVSDTGSGIEPDDTAAIFEAFVQADSSMTRGHGGTGLGLAISRRLMDLMDGAIELDSTPGTGSTFTVRMTLPKGEEQTTTHEGDTNE